MSSKLSGMLVRRCGVILMCVMPGWAVAQAPYRVVAVTGDTAPQTGGARFREFGNPQISNAGHVTFGSTLSAVPAGGGSFGIWQFGPAGDRLVVRRGDQAPHLPEGWRFDSNSLNSVVTNDAGQVALTGQAVLTNNGQFAGSTSGVWRFDPAGDSRLIAQEGQPAPGVSGATFREFESGGHGNRSPVRINPAGEVAFLAPMAPSADVTQANDYGIWSSNGTSTTLRFREGGVPGGAARQPFISESVRPLISMNGAGTIATYATLESFRTEILLTEGVNTQVVAAPNAPAPGAAGQTFTDVLFPSLNDAGDVTFKGILGVNSTGIWRRRGSDGSVGLVARAGDVAPQTGGLRFSFLNHPVTGSDGAALFFGVAGDQVSLWRADSAGLKPLFSRAANVTPTGAGPQFKLTFDMVPVAVNNHGDALFFAGVYENGLDAGLGLWAYGATTGSVELVARPGQTIEVAPGDVRVIEDGLNQSPVFGSNLQSGQQAWFNDAGEVALSIGFADGTDSVVVFQPLPEPNCGVVVIASTAVLLAGRRRRRQQPA